MQDKKQIRALTGARFTAIMVIVFSHFEFLFQYPVGKIYSVVHNATMGVDFFFMLSGFGMMLSSIKKDPNGEEKAGNLKSLFAFGWKHVSKIYPLYVIMLLIGAVQHMLTYIFDYGAPLLNTVADTGIKFILCLTLLQSATGMIQLSHALNSVCWFLSSLFCIYLVSPIVMQHCKRYLKNTKTAMFAIGAAVFCSYVLAILFSWIEANTKFDILCYASPYRRIFYTLCGILVAQIYSFNQKNVTVKFEYISISSAIVWYFARNLVSIKIGDFSYVIDMIICVCVLYALSLEKGRISKFFASKTMVYLGNISMYIFITHYLIRIYIDMIVLKLNLASMSIAFLEIVVILVLTGIVSIMLDRHYPMMQRKIKQTFDKYLAKAFEILKNEL